MFLTRWQPKGGLRPYTAFDSDLDDLLNNFLERRGEEKFWAPSVDILDDKDAYMVKAELPGLKKEDIEVSVENGILTIKGERKFEDEEKKENYHRIERRYGCFSRSVSLPGDINSDKVKASYKDGVLAVEIPKSEKAKAKKVDIDVR